jgi:hypothetical protein
MHQYNLIINSIEGYLGFVQNLKNVPFIKREKNPHRPCLLENINLDVSLDKCFGNKLKK